MKSNYDILGNHIRLIDTRNTDSVTDRVLGINIDKFFMPSVANVIGTDLSKYKLITKGKFACNPMHVGRDERLPVALYEEDKPAIVSPAYFMFEIIDENVLDENYLMMWFRRPEFDRICWLHTDGSVRGGITWDDICRLELPVPAIEKQREIVRSYKAITERIAIKRRINDNLETTLLTIFKEKVVNNPEVSTTISLNSACVQITDGKHGDCESQDNSGYYFISVKDISNGCIEYNNARQITEPDFVDAHKRTNLEAGDILFTNSGTLGRMCLVASNDFTNKTTFQKSVAILKPDKKKLSSTFLYLSLAYYKDKLIEFAHGSAQKNLLLSDMRNFEIKYPSQIVIKEIDLLIQPLFTKIQQNNEEIVSLRKLCNVLLAEIASLNC